MYCAALWHEITTQENFPRCAQNPQSVGTESSITMVWTNQYCIFFKNLLY
jgi:hypothetical protein